MAGSKDKATPARRKELKFINITGACGRLYALTQGGQVYLYHSKGEFPNGDVRYAFWGKITGYKVAEDK